jgi:AraC-like DNA-binding protein
MDMRIELSRLEEREMNDLWIVGVAGGGAGVAVGAPLLLRSPGRDAGDRWSVERLMGFWLVGAAVAMMLIAVRHGSLLPPGVDVAVEHVTNALNLVAWTLLLDLTRRMAGRGPLVPGRPGWHLVLPVTYAVIIAALGGRDIRFIWLMPVSVAGVIGIGAVWMRARVTVTPEVARQVGAVFIASIAFCSAQGIRSLFPRVVELREIVLVVMTLAIFAITFVLVGRRASVDAVPRALTLEGDEARELPRYRKSGLTALDAEQLACELDNRMGAEEWYREPELSLVGIASRLGVAPQALSQALNQRRGVSLTQYLARQRIGAARRLLLDPACDCYTIEGIAQQSGFASRSAFYKSFRDAEGITPTRYRELERTAQSHDVRRRSITPPPSAPPLD